MTREAQIKYKSSRCAVCGLTINEMVEQFGTFSRMTEFHHVKPSKKAKNYDSLIRRKISKEQLQELDKCVLLCRQCHGVVHAQNISVKLRVTVEHNGKEYSQDFTGCCVVNYRDKTVRFLTDQKNLLISYMVKVGVDAPFPMIGTELNSNGFLLNHIQNLHKHKKIEIRDGAGKKVLVIAEYVKVGEIDLKCSYSFPFLSMDFESEDKTSVWIGRGRYVDSNGNVESEGSFSTRVKLENS